MRDLNGQFTRNRAIISLVQCSALPNESCEGKKSSHRLKQSWVCAWLENIEYHDRGVLIVGKSFTETQQLTRVLQLQYKGVACMDSVEGWIVDGGWLPKTVAASAAREVQPACANRILFLPRKARYLHSDPLNPVPRPLQYRISSCSGCHL